MVLINYKKTDNNQFLFDIPADTQISQVLIEVTKINNLRVKLKLLIDSVKGLAEHGPLRPEILRGLTTPETYNPAVEQLSAEERKWAHPKPTSNQKENADPTGYRIGIAPNDELKTKIMDELEKAKKLLDKDMVDKKIITDPKALQEAINVIKGAVMIVYPGYYNLPTWDLTYLILEDRLDYLAAYPDCDWLEADKTTLWWAKKELHNNKKLSDYVGKNEKTKIVVKSMPKGKGAPVNEPPVDEITQKKMMAYYYKKQEESKKLEENNEDDYMNSAWADPRYLKNQLINGGKNVVFKPGLN